MDALPAELLEKLGIRPEELEAQDSKLAPQQVAFLLRRISTMLQEAESFKSLSPEQQGQIRQNTTRIADALARSVGTAASLETAAEVAVEPELPAAPEPTPEPTPKPSQSAAFAGRAPPESDPFAISFA